MPHPAFTQQEGTTPFGITDVGIIARPTFADIDDDGDLDLFIGEFRWQHPLFRNTGTASVPDYVQEGRDEPFGITDIDSSANPALADADGDGDLDLFISNFEGNTLFFRNTGTASIPAYTQQEGNNPFGITDVSSIARTSFWWISIMTAIWTSSSATAPVKPSLRNTAATPVAPVSATTTNGSYGIGDVINSTVGFLRSRLSLKTPHGRHTHSLQKLETGSH